MSVLNKTSYKVLSLITGVLGGAVASALFTRIWRTVTDADDAPEATALDRSTREVLIAATLQGAVFGLVKAGMDRMAAKGFHRFTRD